MSTFKRTMCMLLSLVMVLSMFPVSAFATDAGLEVPAAEPVITEVVPEIAPVMPEVIPAPVPEIIPEPVPEVAPVPDVVPEVPVVPEVIPTEAPVEVPVVTEAPVIPTEEPVVTPAPVVEPVAVYFNCSPAELSLYVYDAYSVPVMPSGIDGAYILMPGSYAYSAYAEGCAGVNYVPFTVVEGSGVMFVDVVLQAVVTEPVEPEQSVKGEELVVIESIGADFYNSTAISGTFNGSSAQTDANGNLLINEVNFTDANFRQYISEQFDTNHLGYLSDAQVDNISSINCSYKNIASLKGIEYFTGLTWLNCSNNALTSIDIRKNIALKQFFCDSNQLTSLNVSANTALTTMQCINNKLTNLVLESNTALTTLMCGTNNLSSLNVSTNTSLETLYCDNNKLASVDLSQNTALYDLECHDNLLTALDLSSNTSLEYLDCANNLISSLDLSNNSALVNLNCENAGIKELNLSKNYKLEYLYCNDNHLPCLDLSSNQNLLGRNATIEPQTAKVEAVFSDGSYVLDMAALVGAENISRVTIISGGEYENGIVTLTGVSGDADNASVVYSFATNGSPAALSVSVNVAIPEKPCEHSAVTDEAVAPTCTEAGLTKGSHCELCGEVLVAQEVVPAAHTEVVDAAVEATCTETGLTEGKHCSACDDVIVAQEIIPANGHKFASGTCSGCGINGGSCGTNLTWTLDKAGTLTISGTGAMRDFSYDPYDKTATMPWYSYRNSIKSVVIEPGVTSIGYYAFYNCTNMTSITIPDGIETIGVWSFGYCSSLTSVAIPASVTAIWDSAFKYCSGLRAVYITDLAAWCSMHMGTDVATGPLYYAGNLYLNNTLATNLKIPTEVTSINSNVFRGCSSLISVTFPESVTSINLGAFYNCSNLNSIHFAGSLPVLNSNCFYGVTATVYYRCGAEGWSDASFSKTGGTISLSPEHNTVIDEAKAATCTETGLTEGSHCSGCGQVYKAQEVLPAAHTNIVTDEAVPPTCTETGLAEGSHCEDCGELIVVQEIIPAAHTNIVTDEAVTPTCTETGLAEGSHCENCGEVIVAQEIIPAEHTNIVTDEAIAPTCTEDGLTEGSHCEGCGEVIEEQEIDPAAHKEITDEAVEPTCIETGLTEGSHCEICGEVIVEQEETPTVDHNFEENYKNDDQCTVCGLIKGTCGSDISWTLDKAGNLTITGTGEMYTIYYSCWSNYHSTIKSVEIESGVTSIGSKAFSGCYNLTDITIPEGVTSIDARAFYNCSSLTEIKLPNSLSSIDDYAFYNCSKLSSITIGTGLTEVGYDTFWGCSQLSKVYISDIAPWCAIDFDSYGHPLSYASTTRSGMLYLNNELVNELVIPDGVTAISNGAFNYFDSISSVIIPASVSSIGKSSFSGCSGLKEIELRHSIDDALTIDSHAFYASTATDTIVKLADEAPNCFVIPTYDWVGSNRNVSYENSTGVVYFGLLDNGLNWILTADGELSISGSGSMALHNEGEYPWSALTDKINAIEIGSNVTSIGSYAFAKIPNLTSVEIPANVNSIGSRAFYDCSKLESISFMHLPTDALSIGYNAFGTSSYSTLKTTVHLNNVEGINPAITAYYWGSRAVTYENPNGNQLEGSCGNGVSFKLLSSGELVISGDGAMYDYSDASHAPWAALADKVASVSINGNLTHIGSSAFAGCRKLTDIVIPVSVSSIGASAFSNCSSLIMIDLPDNLSSIGNNTFENCSNLKSIDIPGTVAGIGDYAFSGCTSLGELVLPGSLVSIGSHAFEGCSGLDSIVIPDSVTSMGDYAFAGCTGLSTVTLSNNLTSINPYVFSGCSSLRELVIPNGVTSLGEGALSGCSGIKKLTVPASLVSIGKDALDNVSPSEGIIYDGTKEQWDSIEGNTIPSDSDDFVFTSHSSGACGTALKWSVNSAGVLFITGSGAMDDYSAENPAPWHEYVSGINTVNLPAGLTKIGANAFAGMAGMSSLNVPASVTAIDSGAFRDCSGLVEIHFASTTAPEIAEDAFVGCSMPNAFYPRGYEDWFRLSKNNPLREYACFMPEGCKDFGDCIKYIIEFAAGGEPETIGISSTITINGDLSIAENVTLVIYENATLTVNGTVSVLGELTVGDGLESRGNLKARSIEIAGAMSTQAMSHIEAGSINVNTGGALDCMIRGSVIDVDALTVSGTLISYTGQINAGTLTCSESSEITLAVGFTDSVDALAQDPGLNVSDSLSIASGKTISIMVTDHKITSGIASANLWPYIDFGGDVTDDAEIFASYLAFPFAKTDIIVNGTVKLDRNVTLGDNCIVAVQAGTAENPGKIVVTPGCRLVNNGIMLVNSTVHVEENGSFRNNGNIIVAEGARISSDLNANTSHGGDGNAKYAKMPASIDLQEALNLGMHELTFNQGTSSIYYIQNDLEVPEDVPLLISNGVVQVISTARLVVHSEVNVTRGILYIAGGYSGPSIYTYDTTVLGVEFPGTLIVNENIYGVRTVNLGGSRNKQAHTLVAPKAQIINIMDPFGNILDNGAVITLDMTQDPDYKLSSDAVPMYASTKVNWKSSSATIATVDSYGLVTFHAPGTVTITATAMDGSGKSANMKFNVLYNGLPSTAKFTATLPAESSGFGQPMNIGLQKGDSVQPSIFGPDKYSPMDPALFEYEVATVANGPFVSVDETGLITAIKAGGTGTVIATFKGDPLKRNVKINVKTISQQISNIALLPFGMVEGAPLPEGFVGVDANGDLCAESGLAPVSYAIMVDKGAARTFHVEPKAMNISGDFETDIAGRFNWASTGTGIATVKANADGSAVITIKANATGACTVTATSKDARKAVGSIAVYVMDYAPRLESTTAILDSQKLGEISLALVESYGNSITGVEYVYNGSDIKASYTDGVLTLKTDKFLKNQTIKGTLKAKTVAGELLYSLPLNVTVKNTAPAVTVKQLEKFNLFYTDSTADMTVTVKNEAVTNVELISSDFSGNWKDEKLTIRFTAPVAKPNTKATLRIYLEGYNAPVEKAVTISTVTTKPTLSFSPAPGVINTGLGESVARTMVLDKAKGQLTLSDGYTVSGGNATAIVRLDGDSISVTGIPNASGKYVNGKVNISIKGANWVDAVTLGFNLSYNTADPSLKLAKTTLTLNAAYKVSADESLLVASHANIRLSEIKIASIYPVKYNSEMDKINIWNENGSIKASIKSGETVKAGSYSYGFIASYGNNVFKEVRFTVKVVNTPLTGKLSKSTLTLNNIFTAQSDSVELLSTKAGLKVSNVSISQAAAVGSAAWNEARHIQFVCTDSNITAKIKDGEYVKPGSYSFNVNSSITDENGEAAMKTLKLTVKVVNTQPKVTLSSNLITLNTIGAVPVFEKGHIALLCSTAGYTVTGCEYELADTQESLLAQAKLIEISTSGADLYANLDSTNMPKLGTYKFKVYPKVTDENGQTVTLNPINFSVKLVNTKLNLSVSMSATGKLDAALRQTSKITYTVTKINSMAGKVIGVELSGDDAGLFNAVLGTPNAKGQPTVILTLKDDVDYSTAKSYKVQFKLLLESSVLLFPNSVDSSVLTVKVSSSAPKFTANPKTLNIYQSQSRSRIVYYTVALNSPADAKIGSIKPGVTGFLQQSLVNEYTNVSAVISEDGKTATIKVVIKDTSKLSASKTYTLPLLIHTAGQAINTADVKLNLSLKVLK